MYQLISNNLTENKNKCISKFNQSRRQVLNFPKKVFVKENFRLKQCNKYHKQIVLSVNKRTKTFESEIDKSKIGRKFLKLHFSNIKKPIKQDSSLSSVQQ